MSGDKPFGDDEVTPPGNPFEPTPKITPARPVPSPRPATILSKADEIERELQPDWAHKTNPAIKLERLDKERKAKLKWKPLKLVSAAVGILTGAGGVGTSLHHSLRARDAAEESTQVIRSARLEERLSNEKEARENLEKKVEGIDRRTTSDSVKLDLVLQRLGVPESKWPKEEP